VTANIDALRRAWKMASLGSVFVLHDRDVGHAVVEFPNPALAPQEWVSISELPAATFRLFVDIEDAQRYRETIIEALAAGDVSVSMTQARYQVKSLTLDEVWGMMFDVQVAFNEKQYELVLEIALSEQRLTHDNPTTIDIIFAEAVLPH
jgi:hypothetical protein